MSGRSVLLPTFRAQEIEELNVDYRSVFIGHLRIMVLRAHCEKLVRKSQYSTTTLIFVWGKWDAKSQDTGGDM